MTLRVVLWLLAALALSPRMALAADPAIPPGLDPGGTAIAVVGNGIDYRDARLARSLARDGEGQIIGWDFVDGDSRPLARSVNKPDAKTVSQAATGRASVEGQDIDALSRNLSPRLRLVIVRAATSNVTQLGQALAYAAKTPARIAVVYGCQLGKPLEDLLVAAAQHAPHMLVIVTGPLSGRSASQSTIAALPTTLIMQRSAADTAIQAAKLLQGEPTLSAMQLKQRLSARVRRH